jgi:hypothetical protein
MKFKFLENKKRKFLLILVVILFLSAFFLVSAYIKGKDVSKDVSIQWISHTEYWKDDMASTIVRLADYRGNPYEVDSCEVSILYPDKSIFINSAQMTESNIEGNWYRADSLQDAPVGTYEQEVICIKGSQTIKSSQSFHLNPALEEISQVSQTLNFTRGELSDFNFSLNAKVQETGEDINFNLNLTEVALSNLINILGDEITNEISSVNSTLGTDLMEINASLSGNILDAESNILLEISESNQNISSLLVDVIQPELELKIEQEIAQVMAEISSVNVSISGIVQSTGESINFNVDATEISLTNLLEDVESNLFSEIESTEANLNTSLNNVQIALSSSLGSTESRLDSQILNVNESISSLLIQVIQPELESLMIQQYNQIMNSISDVYLDTQWLVNNAMNSEDMSAIDSRFDSIDSDLDYIIEFCSNSLTNTSVLCQEIYVLKNTIEIMRQEQQDYFNTLNSTTYNTWELLSGDIYSNIENILITLNLIKTQTEEINETTHKILDEMQGEVRADIIS